MKQHLIENEDGAISVEFMVGLSAIIMLGMAVVMSIDNGTSSVTEEINTSFMPLSMDLMALATPSVGSLSGSSAYNTTQGGETYSQVNCQHYTMSNGETWKSCTETRVSDGGTRDYWLNANSEEVDPPNGV